MNRHQEPMMKFNPATLTYTGVTVGGVTTGGLDFQQEHYSVEGGAITDKFDLIYKKSDKDVVFVEEVELSSSLISIAKKDPNISKYLKGNTLYLTKDTDGQWGKLATDHIKYTGDYMGALNLYSKERTAKLLTKKELSPIYIFICSEQLVSKSHRQTKEAAEQPEQEKNIRKIKTTANSKQALLKEIKNMAINDKLDALSDALSKGVISYEDYEDLIETIV